MNNTLVNVTDFVDVNELSINEINEVAPTSITYTTICSCHINYCYTPSV